MTWRDWQKLYMDSLQVNATLRQQLEAERARIAELEAYKALAEEVARVLLARGDGEIGYEYSLDWLERYDALKPQE